MKTKTFLKNTFVIALVLICFNCNTASINDEEIVSESQNKIGLRITELDCEDTVDVYASYSSNGFSITSESSKIFFQELFSNYYTICNVEETKCFNLDVWTVNASEYYNFVSDIYNGTIDDPANSVGPGNNSVVVSEPGTLPGVYAHCFK